MYDIEDLRIDFSNPCKEDKYMKITFGKNTMTFKGNGDLLYNNNLIGDNKVIYESLEQLFSSCLK